MKPGERQGEIARWREVLNLGEQLLSTKISGTDAIRRQRDMILETARQLVGGEPRLWLSEELAPHDARRLPGGGWQLDETTYPAEPEDELMRQAFQSRCVYCRQAGEPSGGDQPCGETAPCGEDIPAAAAQAVTAPLHPRRGDSPVLGVLQVERTGGQVFSPEEISLVDGLAVQAAIALQAHYRTAVERWRIEQLALVREVSAQIANVRGLDELAQRVTRLVLETFDYYYVSILTLEPGEDHLRFRASAGPGASISNSHPRAAGESPVITVKIGEGMIGQVAATGEEIVANDVSREPRYHHLDVLPETHSEVSLPLKIEDRVLGVLDVQSDQPNDFDESDMLVLRALAGSIAIAIEDTRLYGQLRRRAEHLAAISEVSNAITMILDLEDLLDEVVNLIKKHFGYDFVHIFTVHTGRGKIFYEAGTDERSSALKSEQFGYDLDDPEGIIPWVARNGDIVIANDVFSEPRYRASSLPPHNTRSELTVPLVFGGQVLGVLDVQSSQVNVFSEEDRFLLEALADNIAVAMRNATLYRSERFRRQVADSLREVAGLLSADVDLDQVLHVILIELERTLPYNAAAIWLLDEEQAVRQPEEAAAGLRLAAVTKSAESEDGEQILELENGVSLSELIGFYDRPIERRDGIHPFAWLNEALNAEHPLVREPDTSYDPLGAALDFPGDYSAIAAPLRVGDQPLGVLVLVHRSPGRYGTESRAMTAAFASYASVAIENARLYEAAHEQAWVSTVLLQVAEATQSVSSLNDLLATVVHITPMLVGVRACALYLLDEFEEDFVPAAASGLNSEQQAEFERWRLAPGDAPAFDRLRITKAPLILEGDGEDLWWAQILLDNEEAAGGDRLVLVPLLVRGELLGALLVDYRNGLSNLNTETLFDERLAIIQGIAHQTTMAIENIRLIKAQKEEAYVSVALLQVAQAVVSRNDLDDILAAIVRITPILVGVRRSVLFLWDAGHKVYELSQSYGLPRGAETGQYAAGEFPILDATRHFDSLIAYPLDDTAEVLAEDLEPPESWAQLPLPDLDAVEEYLESDERLLLALPLSAKGQVFGVLLVEEADPLTGGGMGTGSFRRLREKRLEITTGISQQAALAIQNERLQREMVESERLEREFQLAREIQQTFLPDRLPELPGWDLSVNWRPAREVGGDFYDVFDLPGGRIGLVIADVADKGMPAALFMTLIRTLMRATVLEIDSPAAVVERVNEILLPDARQGMFVTLVYAVLTPATGEFIYANAGHNPPILVRGSGEALERLVRGGMALGVLEDYQIEQRSLEIDPGDTMVLYTDGVTEAFSPDGDLYGERRLEQAVEEACVHTAEEMLAAIDQAVSDFIDGLPLQDDLTLMILRREPGS